MLFERGLGLEEQAFIDLLRRVPGSAEIIDTSWIVLRDYLIDSGYLIRTGFLPCVGVKAERDSRGTAWPLFPCPSTRHVRSRPCTATLYSAILIRCVCPSSKRKRS